MNDYPTITQAPDPSMELVHQPARVEDPYPFLVIMVCFALAGLILGGDQ